MFIKKIKIHNYRCFQDFTMELNQQMNIIVGDNEAGKSTILEALNLALTGYVNDRNIRTELSENLFNVEAVKDYLSGIETDKHTKLPFIVVEIYLGLNESADDPEFEKHFHSLFTGQDNSDNDKKASGFSLWISFNDTSFAEEYSSLVQSETSISSLPVEYYDAKWLTFAGTEITPRSIPFKSSLIDSTNHSYYGNGADIYLNYIVKNTLENDDINAITQAHRHLRDIFREDPSIKSINDKISEENSLSEKKISLSVGMVNKNAWLSSLVAELDEIPFSYIGKGEQSIVKTELALRKRNSQNAGIILIEEPENHLSHSHLNMLLQHIAAGYPDKQFIITTHNSFVANKLGLDKLILLADHKTLSLADLNPSTYTFFRTVAGYDTLRMILCKRAILCEGDSDELVLQKYYLQMHGKLPIEDGIEVISVGTSFLRFLEIARRLNCSVSVVTDNDGIPDSRKKKYQDYLGTDSSENIKICLDWDVHDASEFPGFEKLTDKFNYNTLEPEMLLENGLKKMNSILGTAYPDEGSLLKHMHSEKTECALKIFETAETIKFPTYIAEAFS